MNELNMIFGEELHIAGITVKHPKIKDIIEVGEDFYFSSINIFTLNPSDLMVEFYDSGVDYRKLKPYDVFIMLCGETLKKNESDGKIYVNKESEVSKKIGWLTNIYDFYLSANEDCVFLFSPSTKLKIDFSVYTEIRNFLLSINFVNNKEKYNPGNNETVKFLVNEEKKKRKRNARKKKHSVLASQISSLSWSSGFRIEEIKEMYVYQFFDGISRINKIKEYDNVCFGYYSGNIKASDFKRIIEKSNWML